MGQKKICRSNQVATRNLLIKMAIESKSTHKQLMKSAMLALLLLQALIVRQVAGEECGSDADCPPHSYCEYIGGSFQCVGSPWIEILDALKNYRDEYRQN